MDELPKAVPDGPAGLPSVPWLEPGKDELLELMPLLVPVPVPVPLDVPLDVPAPVPPLLVCAFKLAPASRMVEVNTNTLRFMV